jgi:hypothetical protein
VTEDLRWCETHRCHPKFCAAKDHRSLEQRVAALHEKFNDWRAREEAK